MPLLSLLLRWTVVGILVLGSGVAGLHSKTAREELPRELLEPGHVLLMRHALAPGVGDPAGMDLNDCATQRNLDDRGRAQARTLGERLRALGVKDAAVYTSQWCRCRETAKLLGLGPVTDLPALNSFFSAPGTRRERLSALEAFLAGLPRSGPLVVLVTHQVTITALTDYFPDSGAGVILRLRPQGKWERVGTLPALPAN